MSYVTTKTVSSSCFSSLLQDGQLLRLKEGLNHPHGKDVHFGIHQDFFFLQQLFGKKETSHELVSVFSLDACIAHITLWWSLTVYFHLEFVQRQKNDFNKLWKETIKAWATTCSMREKDYFWQLTTRIMTHLHHLRKNKREKDYRGFLDLTQVYFDIV